MALRFLTALLLYVLLGATVLAAPVAGTVIQLSGPLLAKKASGAVKILSVRSEVENGDTLVTEKNTYALVRFIDNSEITLRPASTLTIENFSFDNAKQDGDQARFSLVKGGLRSVTGLLGKRSKEKFELKTPTATIGIRGTTFIAEYVTDGGDTARTAGLYLQVLDGMIHVANAAGAASFAAGQFGHVPGLTLPPVAVPADPGMRFAPPPAFSAPEGPNAPGRGGARPPAAVDCEVR
ncbi:FecR domain-containing protein [Pseudoduganella plicata]|uniref:FecR family protein n=1 Tax=Pseudoduganella plicata TaxID=321984 RepID=UPI001E4DDBC7|nr:FecR family protein [Pseudoduganella plicata]